VVSDHRDRKRVDVELTFEEDFKALDARSLAWCLAYSAGFETMTMGITEWLINDRQRLFERADATGASFVLWHMVEETEHKSVAFVVYQVVCERYWMRIAGLIAASFPVGCMSRRAYRVMLRKDGAWNTILSWLRLWRMVGRFFVKAGAAMLRAMRPGYHPDRVADPEWIAQWQQSFLDMPETGLPLLDTNTSLPAVFRGQTSP